MTAFASAIISPTLASVEGLSIGIGKASVSISEALLFVSSLREGDAIGEPPSEPTDAFAVARATAWFVGASYNFSGKSTQRILCLDSMETRMKPDLFTKVVLTTIALCLLKLAFRASAVESTVLAQQPARVIITGIELHRITGTPVPALPVVLIGTGLRASPDTGTGITTYHPTYEVRVPVQTTATSNKKQ